MEKFLFINNWFQKDKLLLAIGIKDYFEYIAQSNWKELDAFVKKNKNYYLFGNITYDFKNAIEQLESKNLSVHSFPDLFLCRAELVLVFDSLSYSILEGEMNDVLHEKVKQIQKKCYQEQKKPTKIKINKQISKKEYIEQVNKVKKEIQLGNTYELNFCQQFKAHGVKNFDSIAIFSKLLHALQAPFSCYYQLNDSELLCCSPERFFKKQGNQLISEPMKGTISRGKTEQEDQENKRKLLSSEKDLSENRMITDLVRNDLSKIAIKNSVKVDELCGIYSYQNVFQMISKISCQLRENVEFSDIIRSLFPMGSMTGAPKKNTMKLIDLLEKFKRNIYSGTVGYISPNGDMDWNVVIRSLLYDKKHEYLSCPVGGAITIESSPELEYEECLIKVAKILEVIDDQK